MGMIESAEAIGLYLEATDKVRPTIFIDFCWPIKFPGSTEQEQNSMHSTTESGIQTL